LTTTCKAHKRGAMGMHKPSNCMDRVLADCLSRQATCHGDVRTPHVTIIYYYYYYYYYYCCCC